LLLKGFSPSEPLYPVPIPLPLFFRPLRGENIATNFCTLSFLCSFGNPVGGLHPLFFPRVLLRFVGRGSAFASIPGRFLQRLTFPRLFFSRPPATFKPFFFFFAAFGGNWTGFLAISFPKRRFCFFQGLTSGFRQTVSPSSLFFFSKGDGFLVWQLRLGMLRKPQKTRLCLHFFWVNSPWFFSFKKEVEEPSIFF